MPNILELRELTKVFHMGSLLSKVRITAVDRVSLHVESAEIFGLAGESGCGKTTIARMILGFQEPTAGEVVHAAADPAAPGTGNARVSSRAQGIFQNPFEAFNPLRRVERYFFETDRNFGLSADGAETMERIERALGAVGLHYDDIAHRYPAEFSGGQLQRISIARALLTQPPLLVADEPVSMVDASLRMSIVNLFEKIRDEFGISVIYITHDLATAYYVCRRIAVMFRGNVVEMGEVEKVLMDPKHPYTALLRESIRSPIRSAGGPRRWSWSKASARSTSGSAASSRGAVRTRWRSAGKRCRRTSRWTGSSSSASCTIRRAAGGSRKRRGSDILRKWRGSRQ